MPFTLSPASAAWQQRRNELNHDWLKNRYLPAIAGFLNVIRGKWRNPEIERDFLEESLPQWEGQVEEAVSLLEEFEAAVSPASLLGDAPLASLEEEDVGALRRLIHELWVERLKIRRSLGRARESLARASTSYRRASKAAARRKDLPLIEKELSAFFEDCRSLSAAIEELPTELRLT